METEALLDNLYLLTDCPHPARNQDMCNELGDRAIRSLLVIADDPTPALLGLAGGLWCYVLPLLNPDTPGPFERQSICDFANYERSHGRTVGVWVGSEKARPIVCAAACETPQTDPAERVLPSQDNSICCRTYHPKGCDGRLLCHATTVTGAVGILKSGQILSKHRLTGIPLEQLAEDGTWGDPPDYFDYVALARGNCVAPDIVAISRQTGRDLSPEDADEVFYPGVRFFFDTRVVFNHPRGAWDGIHPLKVRDSLELDQYLYAIVAPSLRRDGQPLTLEAAGVLRSKVVYLDHREHFGLCVWSTASLRAAYQCEKGLCK